MSKRMPDPIQVSEAELRRATSDLDQFHQDTFPEFRRELVSWAAQAREQAARATGLVASRRGFLVGSGAVVGGLVLAACGGGNNKKSTTTTSMSTPTSSGSSTSSSTGTGTSKALTGDAEVAGTAASLENLAVAAYTMGIQAATAGKLGTVPPAVVTFAETAKSQHSQHADAFNAVVSAAGQPKVTKPDPVVLPTVTTAFNGVHDVTGLAMLALELEEVAANTYENDLGMNLSSSRLIGALSTIQPVERMHAAILHFVLGQYPVPETFQATMVGQPTGARPNSDINMA